MKLHSKKLICLFLALVLLPNGCKESSNLNSVNNEGLTGDQIATLNSLQQLSDYPFFRMTYFGDYNSSEYFFNKNLSSPRAGASSYKVGIPEKWACSCYAAMGDQQQMLFARNFDWIHNCALILFTDPPGVYASVSMVDIYYCGYRNTHSYDDLKDRRILLDAPYFPFDGMNECGVAVGLMAVPYAEPPFDPGKKTIYDLEVIRLILDFASTSQEAISLIKQFNIKFDGVPLHYLVADRYGNSAIVEFTNNKMQVIPNEEPFQVSTNFIISNVQPNLSGRCWRYDIISTSLNEKNGIISQPIGMEILQNAAQQNTMWSLVYNMSTGDLSAAIDRDYQQQYNLSLNK